jgi:pyruvate formate lyase activating enzyme
MGAFKWKAMGLDYKLLDTPPAGKDLVDRVVGQFRSAGCQVR